MEEIPFVLDANSLVEFQACRRKFLLSRRWRPSRWVAKVLFDTCLRHALAALSQGEALTSVVKSATTRFMTTAANPGLEMIAGDPYTVATDWCAMLETILHAMAKRALPVLSEHTSVEIGDGLEWSFVNHVGDDGYLHRVITCTGFDADRMALEAHGWRCFGDIAAAKKPMKLHVIEIGHMRDGRRHSPWARAFRHSYIKNGRIKFSRKGTKDLQGDVWKPVYLADDQSYDAKMWVECLEEDGVLDTLVKTVVLDVPDRQHIKEFRRQIAIEAGQMQQWLAQEIDPRMIPMSRAACDTPFPCAFQSVCFSPDVDVDVASLGIYLPRLVRT